MQAGAQAAILPRVFLTGLLSALLFAIVLIALLVAGFGSSFPLFVP